MSRFLTYAFVAVFFLFGIAAAAGAVWISLSVSRTGPPGAERDFAWSYLYYPHAVVTVVQLPPESHKNASVFHSRQWPDSNETLFTAGIVSPYTPLKAGSGFSFSLPFTLPTILTTLALLFLTAGVWLLWRDRKRRRWLRGAAASLQS